MIVVVKAATTIGTNITTTGTWSSGNATSTGYLVVGTTNPQNNMGVGDLLLGGNATTTGDLVISGGDLNKNGTALTIGAALTVSGAATLSSTLTVTGNATSSGYFIVGTANPANNMAAGDLLLGGNATTTGDLVISGGDLNKNGTGITIGGRATGTTAIIVGSETTAATTTMKIKTDGSAGARSCLEMVNTSDGAIYRVFLNGTSFIIQAGACN